MPQIKHCDQYRVTDTVWLNSNEAPYQYQLLLSTTCPKCSQFVMEYVGIFADLRFGAQKRIKVKDHEEWIARSSLATGDVALGMDSSAWKSKRAGVHWVHSSQREWPFLPIKVRVK